MGGQPLQGLAARTPVFGAAVFRPDTEPAGCLDTAQYGGETWVLMQRVLQTIYHMLQTIQPMMLNTPQYQVDQKLLVLTTAACTLSDH